MRMMKIFLDERVDTGEKIITCIKKLQLDCVSIIIIRVQLDGVAPIDMIYMMRFLGDRGRAITSDDAKQKQRRRGVGQGSGDAGTCTCKCINVALDLR